MPEQQKRKPYVGRPMPRLEDFRLITGQGRYTDDLSFPDQVYGYFVRSPHAHARILSVDTKAARAMDGVVAVFAAEDFVASGARGVNQVANPAGVVDYKIKSFGRDGSLVFERPHLPFARDKVRYVGEPVVMAIAKSVAQARDACEAVAIDYKVLPSVVDAAAALKPGAPLVFEEVPGNCAVEHAGGDKARVDAAFAAAHLIVEETFRASRAVAVQMEPRSHVGRFDPVTGELTFLSGTQGVVRVKNDLAYVLNLPPEKVHVITQDVGGAFGLRTHPNLEQVAVAWAAHQLKRTVKWTSDRTEAFLGDYQGRDMITVAKLALDEKGKMLGLSIDMIGNVGGHPVSYVFLNNAAHVQPTVYDLPCAHIRLRAALTNTVPTAPYRGAGRPEAIHTLERLIDMAAAKLGVDRVELRRRNMVKRSQFPYVSVTGLTYDSGDFVGNQKKVAELADWKGFPARRRAAKKRNKLAGIGVANYVETPVGAPMEWVDVKVLPEGKVEVAVGTQSSGQGHETTFAQVVADELGITPEEIKIVTGDTRIIPAGGGTHSDRSMRIAGKIMVEASENVVAQARKAFAAMAGAGENDVKFDDGMFSSPRSNLRLGIFDLARAIQQDASIPPDLRKPLRSEAKFAGRLPAYPTGSAICEVEIDADTGVVEIVRYASVDDAGQVINPLVPLPTLFKHH